MMFVCRCGPTLEEPALRQNLGVRFLAKPRQQGGALTDCATRAILSCCAAHDVCLPVWPHLRRTCLTAEPWRSVSGETSAAGRAALTDCATRAILSCCAAAFMRLFNYTLSKSYLSIIFQQIIYFFRLTMFLKLC